MLCRRETEKMCLCFIQPYIYIKLETVLNANGVTGMGRCEDKAFLYLNLFSMLYKC